jgi:hypothetical protein
VGCYSEEKNRTQKKPMDEDSLDLASRNDTSNICTEFSQLWEATILCNERGQR